MADDPNAARKLAILQSLTTEAGGFYSLIVTVASSFLAGSLLFLEKFAPVNNVGVTMLLLSTAWIALLGAIACICRVRLCNTRSANLALQDRFEEASIIDKHTGRLSSISQWLLISGMAILLLMGAITFFANQDRNERKQAVSDKKEAIIQPGEVRESIGYGSLGQPAQPPTAIPSGNQGTQSPQVPSQQTGDQNGGK